MVRRSIVPKSNHKISLYHATVLSTKVIARLMVLYRGIVALLLNLNIGNFIQLLV